MTDVWNVIYLWQGERHLGGQFSCRDDAMKAVVAMRDTGLICWVEWVGYREVSP